MARRKATTRRKTGTTARKRRTTPRRAVRKKSSNSLVNFFVPLFFIGCILVCLGFLLFMGYQTVTASSFFELDSENGIEIIGDINVPKEKIAQIVKSNTDDNIVWNSDVDAIKSEIKKFPYAREVSVSKVLPDRIRVYVQARVPIAIVRVNGNDYWVDVEGKRLNKVKEEEHPPFTMFGWAEDNSDAATEDNIKRVKLYLELLENWKSYEIAKRVKAVDLSDIKDPQAIVEDSGQTVRILLSKEDYGKRLKLGLESIVGRGKEIKSIDMSGTNPIISYRDS
jgi:cell division septal protein FtsQ